MEDESTVLKKYVRSINFLRTPPPHGGNTSTATTTTSIRSSDNTSSISYQSNAGSDRVDSIKSCESVLKIFTFEPSTFNKNNEKCLAFWNVINKRDDISPVNCMIMDANNNQRDTECQTELKECEASLWARALYELRKRKLDKVALATTLETCPFCKTLNCRHTSPTYNPKDLVDHDDLSELNNWDPRTKDKSIQFGHIFEEDVGTVPPTLQSMEEMISKDSSTPPATLLEYPTSNKKAKSDEIANTSASSSADTDKSAETTIKSISDTEVLKIIELEPTKQPSLGVLESGSDIVQAVEDTEKFPTMHPSTTTAVSELSKKKVSISDVIKTNASAYNSRQNVQLGGLLRMQMNQTAPTAVEIALEKHQSRSNMKSGSITSHKIPESKKSAETMSCTSTKQISFYSRVKSYSGLRRISDASEVLKLPDVKSSSQDATKVPSKSSLHQLSFEREKMFTDSNPNILDAPVIKSSAKTSSKDIAPEQNVPLSLETPTSSQTKTITEKKSKVEFEQDQFKEISTNIQNLSSLLDISTVQHLRKIAKRKEKLEQTSTGGIYAITQQYPDSKIYLCSCIPTLKKLSCDACPCKEGICKIPSKTQRMSDLKKMEQAFDHMSDEEKNKMKCFLKILYQVKEIMKQNFDTETMDAKILDVLSGLDACECEGGCECKIHHLDIPAMRDDQNFMQATLLDRFNKVLDERFEAKLGEVIKKKCELKTIGTQMEEPAPDNMDLPGKKQCSICRLQNCRCIQN